MSHLKLNISCCKKFNTLFTIKTQIVHEFITFALYMRAMKTKTQTVKLINGNQSFPTLAISQRTAEDMATIIGVVAIVAAVLSLPIAIFVLTYGIGN
jgi:hypothetical protein